MGNGNEREISDLEASIELLTPHGERELLALRRPLERPVALLTPHGERELEKNNHSTRQLTVS